ncbi:peroxisomal carnitine O-octanoyltransferase-like protein [Dinothrombium tinctorium]|uniref:Peroxisomal carnitine O-octanoyltransferase n=1 Tax=Dinothrombium tinctorium TaxID=1965070 RepID=A0A3S3NXU5_9ACAR|nr:peroxisomal carnitine O-octanoyltransferase-like protein [Dinothrombium tinctorium]
MKEKSLHYSSLGSKSLRDQLYVSESNKTFENDETLPSLPIPSLHNTLDLYLDTVRPVVDNAEFAATEEIVKKFENGIGQKLHQKLVQRAQGKRNWLEEWWLDYAYLYNRGPLLPFSSMSAPMQTYDFWPPQPGSRVERTAINLFFTLEFWKLLRTEKMRPMVHKGVAWDMSQFKRLFNTCRIPHSVKDNLMCLFRTESEGDPAPTNIIILYCGHIFSFDAIDENEEPLTPQELAFQLYYIEKWCQAQNSRGQGIGSLTVGKRNDWANNREYLKQLSPQNVRNLEKIEKALMVLIFDDSEPVSQKEVMQEVMCGACADRWADKSISLIGFKNGIFGAMADHTPFDGLCTAVFTHYVMTSISEIKGVFKGMNKFRELPRPERLEFVIDEKISAEVEKSKSEYHANCSSIDLAHCTFDEFGKAILRQHRFHPEAFVQIALQLAYYRMYGKPAPTYCTASTRQFYHGRTETCRSCFPEAVDFAKAVVQGTASPGELYSLLSKAVNKFQHVMKKAMQNEGCDRHFLGLYVISLEEGIELPDIFTDPSFIKSGGGGNYILSTSCAGYWNICGGVPPMREDGYGCFYGIEDNKITFCCVSFKNCAETESQVFYNNVRMSLLDMRNILNSSKL